MGVVWCRGCSFTFGEGLQFFSNLKSVDIPKQHMFDYAYGKLLKGMGLFSIGAISIGLAVYDRSNESKANLMYILGGVVVGTYGLSEGWKGIKILKRL